MECHLCHWIFEKLYMCKKMVVWNWFLINFQHKLLVLVNVITCNPQMVVEHCAIDEQRMFYHQLYFIIVCYKVNGPKVAHVVSIVSFFIIFTGPTPQLGATSALLNNYFILGIFLCVFQKTSNFLKSFLNIIMLSCTLKDIQKYVIKKYFQIVFLVSNLL